MVVVPLYDTLGPDAIRFIINTGKNTHITHRPTNAELAATLTRTQKVHCETATHISVTEAAAFSRKAPLSGV